ncbi:hypothetical protein BDD12DRAFT_748467 [Trichophaea hybrida]|nr:hypothetical protein BDD12DRAFT_748467 [Trichophaea hybrida]
MSAKANTVHLTAPRGGLLSLPGITPTSAQAANERLTENHTTHHIFFNTDGFHNHIAHHLLALYDVGAPASLIHESYHRGTSYQRDISAVCPPKVTDLSDTAQWSKFLEKEEHYISFLEYFRNEIEKRGYEDVVNTTLFSGTELADDMLVRLFAGFLHPFIHVGYGLEFQQPAIVAEGLAMAAISDNWISAVLAKGEEAAAVINSKTLVSLLGEIRNNDKLRTAPLWTDGNKVQGIIERAPEEMLSYVKQYKVPVDKLEEKMAESMNAAALFTAASQREDKQIKIDFYYMHAHNSSIFLPTYISQPWISQATKARLLEWKGRHDLALYASRRAPELRVDDIQTYVPKQKSVTNPWLNVFHRALKFPEDDGHVIKFIRSCAVGERICANYQTHEDQGFVVKGDMWIKIAQMCIDSVEEDGVTWARSVGFDEAWEKYGPRIQY